MLCLILFILMPLSTDFIEDMEPYRMRITKHDSLQQDSDILINQVRSLSKKRVGKKIAALTKSEYELVIKSLCKNFV